MKTKYSESIPVLHTFVKQELERIAKSRTLASSLVQRAKIILLSATGLRNKEIAKQVNVDRKNVGRWRRRFLDRLDFINDLARRQDYKNCSKAIKEVLSDKKRTGRPKKFSKEDHDSVTAVACSNPASYNYPISSWSVRSIAMVLAKLKILPDISKSSIQRILQRNQLRPHKLRYWIHSPEKYQDPYSFIQKARECSSLLKSAGDLYEKGVQIISIDEKPGISILKPVYPDLFPLPGRVDRKREMFYKRRGTIDLIQGVNVAMGDLYTPYLNAHHKEKDFVKALSQCLDEQLKITPEDEIIIICDNFSTHLSEGVVRLVCRYLKMDTVSLGIKNYSGILKNKKTRARFLSDPGHKIRFVYTPKHASWLNPVEVYFSILQRRLLKGLLVEHVKELEEIIFKFFKWYNENLANPFEYKFSGFDKKLKQLEQKITLDSPVN